jgi:ABC-type sugar transport system permease subunit
MAKKLVLNRATKRRHNIIGYCFLAPWLIGFLIFTALPFFYTIYLSLNTVSITGLGIKYTWVFLNNYINALFKDTFAYGSVTYVQMLSQLIMNLLVFVPTVTIISLILALLLNQKIKLRGFLRTIYFLPVIILSGPVLSQFINTGSSRIEGVQSVFVYRIIAAYSPELVTALDILFNNFSLVLWFTGIPIVLYINGLQKINPSLYEAAEIDGATAWQSLWKITIPIIKPIALIVAIFTIVQIGTSPLNPTQWILDEVMKNQSSGQGRAAAYAWIYSLIMLGAIGVITLILKDRSKNEVFVDIRDKQAERINRIIRRSKIKKLFNPFTFKKTYQDLRLERAEKKKKEQDALADSRREN